MENTKLEAFCIVGIAVKTTNENNQSDTDIQALWNKFMSEGLIDKIPNKVDSTIYSLYTDYEGDHTKPYTAILGCKVSNLDTVPTGMVSKKIGAVNYAKVVSKGDLTAGLIYQEWLNIWQMDLNRTYIADFETYGTKAQNPKDAEVDIYIGLK